MEVLLYGNLGQSLKKITITVGIILSRQFGFLFFLNAVYIYYIPTLVYPRHCVVSFPAHWNGQPLQTKMGSSTCTSQLK